MKIAGIRKFMKDYNDWAYELWKLQELKKKKDIIERIEKQ
jgi:hypothetical protein